MTKLIFICALVLVLVVVGGKSQPLKIPTSPLARSIISAAEQSNEAYLCDLRQDLSTSQNSEETNTLIEFLDHIASEKFGFNPSLCKKPVLHTVAESDLPKDMLPYEDGDIEKALDLNEFLSDDPSDNPLNDTLVLDDFDSSGDGDLSNNFACTNCQESSQNQIVDTFKENRINDEKTAFFIDLGIGLLLVLLGIILIVYSIVYNCCIFSPAEEK
jgi:hypothetical protein